MSASEHQDWLAQEQVHIASTMYDSAPAFTRQLLRSLEAWARTWQEEDAGEEQPPSVLGDREAQMLDLADSHYDDYRRHERAREALIAAAPQEILERSASAPPDPLGGHRPLELGGTDSRGRTWRGLACFDCSWRWIHRDGVAPEDVARRHRAAHLDPPPAALCDQHGFPAVFHADVEHWFRPRVSEGWPPPAVARSYLWQGRHGPWPITVCATCLEELKNAPTSDVEWDGRVESLDTSGYPNAVRPAPWSDPSGQEVPEPSGARRDAGPFDAPAELSRTRELGASIEDVESCRLRAIEPWLVVRALETGVDPQELCRISDDGACARSYIELLAAGSSRELARELARHLPAGVLPETERIDATRLAEVRPRTRYALRDYLHLRAGVGADPLDHGRALAVVDAGIPWLHYVVARRLGRTHESAVATLAARGAANLVGRVSELARMGENEESSGTYEHLLDRYGDRSEAPVRHQIASAMLDRAVQLNADGHHDDALDLNAHAIAVAESLGPDVDGRETLARAMNNEGAYLCRLDRIDEALQTFARVADRLPVPTNAGGASRLAEDRVVEQVLRALASRGSILLQTERNAEALVAYERILEIAESSQFRFTWWEQKARAQLDRGVTLAALGRHREAIESYDALLDRLQDDRGARILTTKARINKALAQLDLEQLDDALASFDAVIEGADGDPSVEIQQQLAKAFVGRGSVLGRMGRHAEERRSFQDALDSFGTSDDALLRVEVIHAHLGIAQSWGEQDRVEEELAERLALVERIGDDPPPGGRAALVNNVLRASRLLAQAGRHAEVLDLTDRYLAVFGSDGSGAARLGAAVLLTARGIALGNLGREDEQLSTYREVVRRYGDDAALETPVAWALFDEGLALHNSSRWEEALGVYASVLQRHPAGGEGELAVVLARSRLNSGMVLEELGRVDEARVHYAAVVDQNAGDPTDDLPPIVEQARTYLAELDGGQPLV